jgi:hypothetical protein
MIIREDEVVSKRVYIYINLQRTIREEDIA